MRIAMFSTQPYDRESFSEANKTFDHEIKFLKPVLSHETAPLAKGYPAVCAFVHDELSRDVQQILKEGGTGIIALRSAGFNNVDLQAAKELGMTVVRVPAYSPHAVAEHALALILALNRKTHRAYARVREGNFSLDGLQGFDLNGKKAGLIGTGKIGAVLAKMLVAIGCHVEAFDVNPNPDCAAIGIEYVPLKDLFASSDIISLHCPLLPSTRHIVNEEVVATMKPGVMLINTSRGGLVDTRSVIQGLKTGKIGYLGLDVYEEEEDLFFRDLSNAVIQDDVFARLTTFPNVIVTCHQAFLTKEALQQIANTTLGNVSTLENGEKCPNEVVEQRRG